MCFSSIFPSLIWCRWVYSPQSFLRCSLSFSALLSILIIHALSWGCHLYTIRCSFLREADLYLWLIQLFIYLFFLKYAALWKPSKTENVLRSLQVKTCINRSLLIRLLMLQIVPSLPWPGWVRKIKFSACNLNKNRQSKPSLTVNINKKALQKLGHIYKSVRIAEILLLNSLC